MTVELFFGFMILAIVLIFIAGFFCLLRSFNMIKIILAVEVLMKGVTLLLILAGHLSMQMALMQTFVITMIVIEAVIAVVAVGIILNLRRQNGSLDAHQLSEKEE